ncbi:MAG TPA: ABC transporter permease [Pseudomonadales bacterium]|nr:ABC transporter permease [Pseudomonadales bacterium]
MIRSLERVLAIAAKEFRHLTRDRLTGGLVVGIPLVMTLLFGFAINNDVRGLRAASVDHARTSLSRALLADAVASQVITRPVAVASEAELERLLRAGQISVGLVVPADLEARVARGATPLMQLMVDGSDPTILGAARGLERLGLPGSAVRREGIFAVRAWFNPERRSPVFIVPGLVGVILTLTMVLFTSIAIVRERERGNLELLITTPVRALELMVGKIAPYVLIGYLQVSLILTLGAFLFAVPIRGSLTDFYLTAGVFVASVLTLGLLISTLAATQFQAFQMTFMTFLPQLLLSGYMFPFEGMPRAAQMLAELFPLTHYLRIVRGIVLRDADLAMLVPELWPLALFFVVVMTLATLRFRKRLD